jgi:hypothetical protein
VLRHAPELTAAVRDGDRKLEKCVNLEMHFALKNRVNSGARPCLRRSTAPTNTEGSPKISGRSRGGFVLNGVEPFNFAPWLMGLNDTQSGWSGKLHTP